jgi:GTP pyrophosphokinase
MVAMRERIPLDDKGAVDVSSWHRHLIEDGFPDPEQLLPKAIALLASVAEANPELNERGVQFANLVIGLQLDSGCAAAALLYRCHREKFCTAAQIAESTSSEVADLVAAVARMADSSLLEMSSSKMQSSEARDQVDNIRRMLVSMIDDGRVAILKLAERVVALRAAKAASEEHKRRIAQEALLIFAPLANRLGIWHLKWELEDLALRYLEPDVYRALAKQLDGRRAERELQVKEIAESVQSQLRARGLDATVYGRAKHIFSIWRKMRAKNVKLDEVYDQRAIRIIVPDIGQCYSALGVVHTEWQHIPREFDDYIAVPKENGYRSIHTAVVGDDGKTLEVQIRTPEMHQESELGVCAHWMYKDGRGEDQTYTEKMNWLRRVVERQEETQEHGSTDLIGEELSHRVREERIFVYTPKGHVLDLTTGATPVDFAYRVHTEIGHRCRAARVDGQIVALNTPLETGECVEILTGDQAEPQRDWLENHLGYVASSRAREKVREWFAARSRDENLTAGRKLLAQVLDRLLLPNPTDLELDALATQLGFDTAENLLIGLAAGDCQTLDIVAESAGERNAPTQLTLLPEMKGRGRESFTIDVRAIDREGLLLDITTFLKESGVSLSSNRGSADEATGIAAIVLDVKLASFVELAVIIDGLRQIPDVIDARRVTQQAVPAGSTDALPRSPLPPLQRP